MFKSDTNLSPRLIRLLDLLLCANAPVKVDVLAQKLESSRRTVFRELEYASGVLASFQGELISVPGKGIMFSGNAETRRQLHEILSQYIQPPATKRERLIRLLTELVSHAGTVQKLYFYADILKVSESTISHDLDELEEWLSEQEVRVTRKSGLGVRLDGEESALRTVLVNSFITNISAGGKSYTQVFAYPGERIESGVHKVLSAVSEDIDWMTSESLNMISVYLMVMIERIIKNKIIVREDSNHIIFQKDLTEKLANEIEKEFSIEVPSYERSVLAEWIHACRAKSDTPLESESAERQSLITNLTFKMIDRFDPLLSMTLKTNEHLVKLLSHHLEATLTRLEYHIELPNPLEEELIKSYPEVYRNTCQAVKVIEEELGYSVPVNEISFIQIHFLAALADLGEQNIRRRVLRAFVVCLSGIGAGYMLAYQIRKRFKGELEVEVSGYDEKSAWKNADFLVATVPLSEIEKPVVLVKTILGEEDYQKIHDTVNALAFSDRTEIKQSVSFSAMEERLNDMIDIFAQARILLDNFSVEKCKADSSFEELVRFASSRYAPEKSEIVYQALMRREKLATQVVQELKIALLHARTSGVSAPVFAIIIPEGGMFTDIYFKNTESCVLMLMPENANSEMTKLMGSLSSALIDVPSFLKSVCEGNKEEIKAMLEIEISEILDRYCGVKFL